MTFLRNFLGILTILLLVICFTALPINTSPACALNTTNLATTTALSSAQITKTVNPANIISLKKDAWTSARLQPFGVLNSLATPPSQRDSVIVNDPFNSRFSILVGADGRFNMGAFPDESGSATASSWSIMYIWPSSPGTSFTTFRIDGTDNEYGSSGTQIQAPTDIDASTNQSEWQIGDIQVTQKLQIVHNNLTNQNDVASISYTVKNVGTSTHQVGGRVMIDTDLNGNDGAPFRVPGVGITTNETDFSGTNVPDNVFAFFDVTDSVHVAAATLKSGGATPPDRLVLAAWPNIVDTEYDYTVSPSQILTNDSAYAVYWNPTTLATGQSRTYTTFYGLAQLQADLTPPLALGVTAPQTLSVINNAYSPNPFTVTATVLNNGTAAAENVALTISLPSGLSLASGSPTQVIGSLAVNQERQVTWSVSASPHSSASTLNYSVSATADNTAPKVLNQQIILPAVATQSTCGDVLFIGARGSGEPGPGTRSWQPTQEDPNGFGDTVLSSFNKITANIGSQLRVVPVSVEYPADPVDVGVLALHSDEYFAGLIEGHGFVMNKLITRARICPNERIVLVGYSQGAMVMHRALQQLHEISVDDPRGIGAKIVDRLEVAILIGDGDRVPADITKYYGTMHRRFSGIGLENGFGLNLTSLSLSNRELFPLSLDPRNKIFEVCNKTDIVCDEPILFIDVPRGKQVHSAYANSPALTQASDDAVRQILSTPIATTSINLSATAGTPFTNQLSAKAGGNYTLQWGVLPPARMPRGLSLGIDGLISGIPRETPTGQTLIRVRSMLQGVSGSWVPVTLNWNAAVNI